MRIKGGLHPEIVSDGVEHGEGITLPEAEQRMPGPPVHGCS